MITEVICLPTEPGTAQRLVDFMQGHAFFAQDAILGVRMLRADAYDEVIVIIDWTSPEAHEATSATDTSQAFLAGVLPLVSGPADIKSYVPAD